MKSKFFTSLQTPNGPKTRKYILRILLQSSAKYKIEVEM